uniref:Beta-crystallin A2 n=1 Tax=Leptobrachium leishanense TaxID=445787 RepID=A0A8C5WCC9_9ANUR
MCSVSHGVGGCEAQKDVIDVRRGPAAHASSKPNRCLMPGALGGRDTGIRPPQGPKPRQGEREFDFLWQETNSSYTQDILENEGNLNVSFLRSTMSTQPIETLGQWKVTVWEEENFQGKRCEFLIECPNIMERGFRRIRSVKVENGPWVGYEYPEFQGQQFILEKGDYPRWEAWSGNSGYRTEHLLSFRPVKSANHSDSKVTLYDGDNFQGRKFELCDDYPSLQAMGWCSKEVASIKINSGAWVAYQYPGYRGYQYVLERDRHNGEYKNYNEYSTQAHTNQIQSIRRIQH